MLFIQVLLYLLLFTAAVASVVANGAVGGLFFYPEPVRQRALELGLTDEATVRRRRKRFFTALLILIAAWPVFSIGVWNRVTDFRTAYVQALVLLESMNWYDGIVIDRLWVGHSRFWVLRGCEDLPYTKSVRLVMMERGMMTLIYLPAAAVLAKIAVWVGKAI